MITDPGDFEFRWQEQRRVQVTWTTGFEEDPDSTITDASFGGAEGRSGKLDQLVRKWEKNAHFKLWREVSLNRGLNAR